MVLIIVFSGDVSSTRQQCISGTQLKRNLVKRIRIQCIYEHGEVPFSRRSFMLMEAHQPAGPCCWLQVAANSKHNIT